MEQFIAAAVMLTLMLSPGLGVGIWCVTRMWQGRPILERAVRKPSPWGVLEVGLVVLITLPTQFAFVYIAIALSGAKGGPNPGPQDTLMLLTAGSLAFGLLALVAIALAMIRSDDWTGDLGWDMREALGDLQTGLLAFLLLAPITYGLQALLTMWFQFPSKHPLIELLQSPGGMSYFPLACFLAVIVAPVAEEILFRWFLQGWLQNFIWPIDAQTAWIGRPRAPTGDEAGEVALHHTGPLLAEVTVAKPVEKSVSPGDFNPYAASHLPADGPWEPLKPVAALPAVVPEDGWLEMWPIALSAAIFALLHYGHGPDWIPLFPFALGLGYLYYRTGRLLPSITVHFLLNGTSMFFLWLHIVFGKGV